MPVMVILRFAALAAIRIRRSRSTSCADRKRRQSMSWSATCAAKIALRFVAIHLSAVIWSRFGQRKSRRAIRHQRGGRASGDVCVGRLKMAKAYLVVEHIITDAAKFEEYRTKVGPMIA